MQCQNLQSTAPSEWQWHMTQPNNSLWLVDAFLLCVHVWLSINLSKKRNPIKTNQTWLGLFFQVCGPTIPKDCKSITMYNGICVWINQNDQRENFYPSSGEGNFTACCHNYGSLVRHLTRCMDWPEKGCCEVNRLFFSTECRAEADIAFLMDGSGSVVSADFNKMKEFVINLIRLLQGKYTKVELL